MFKQIIRKCSIVVITYIVGILLVLGTYASIAKYNGLDIYFTTVYNVCPVLVIKDTDNIFLDNNGTDSEEGTLGGSIGPVLLLAGDADDTIVAHELVHTRQGYRNSFLLYHIKYSYIPYYTILYEYEAYKAEPHPFRESLIIELLADYKVGLTKNQITDIIEEHNAI